MNSNRTDMPKGTIAVAQATVALSLVLFSLSACVQGPAKPADVEAAAAAKLLEDSLRESQRRVAALELQLVARDAEQARLAADLDASKKRLDEAVLEVVRSKAKLGSLNSRAEAATALAESELLLKGLRGRGGPVLRGAELAAAERLLALGNREFQAGNFGGAHYLAGSARVTLAALLAQAETPVQNANEAGERRFAEKVPFQMGMRGNVRAAPNADSRVVRVAERGTPLVGIAARQYWVQVEFGDGLRGWVYFDLLVPG